MISVKICLVFIGIVLGLSICGMINIREFLGLSLPTDNALEANFRNNKEEFERLKKLFQEDKHLSGITLNSVFSSNYSLIKEGNNDFPQLIRLQEYRHLMKNNKIAGGIDRNSRYSDAIFFQVVSLEVGKIDEYQTCIDEKGYVFSENELSPTLDNLDHPDKIEKGIAFKKIENNWYIYYKKTVGKPE